MLYTTGQFHLELPQAEIVALVSFWAFNNHALGSAASNPGRRALGARKRFSG
jgi:hypothetical protein